MTKMEPGMKEVSASHDSKETGIASDSSVANLDDDLKDDDCYHYTKRGEFTSELYKICVDNLPNYVGYQQMRKIFGKLNVKPRKLKFDPNCRLAFLTFGSEEEREAAIKAIDGHHFKKHILYAKKAKPKPDPQLRKRQIQASGEGEMKKRRKQPDEPTDDRPPETRLKYVVAKLCDMPYAEQLKPKAFPAFFGVLVRSSRGYVNSCGITTPKNDVLKKDVVDDVMKNLTKDLLSVHADSWVTMQSGQNDGMCCKLEDIIQSPILDKYRNKVEFNIGPNTDGKTATVGFRLGTYKDDNFAVVEPSECINVSDEAKKIAKIFQGFVQQSDKAYYDPGIHTGYWRQLTVRSCRSGEIMVTVQVHPQDMNRDDIESMKQSLKDLFFDDEGGAIISSLYLEQRGQGRSGQNNAETYEHVYGSKVIHEEMLDLKFQISPDAFFQVNTPAAEMLYSKVREWCDITEDTTVLDVCCGTGTIGLFLAKAGAKKVIGVELCQQAIEDAKKNATLNGIKNTEFICGKAEDVLPSLVNRLYGTNVIAVVDPPRAGLHKKVVLALRRCLQIKRLIFVSCDAKKASTNFLDLCRPTTNRNKGDPYRLVRAVPVDLFPHTLHCELVLLMERITKEEHSGTIPTLKEEAKMNITNTSKADMKEELDANVTENIET